MPLNVSGVTRLPSRDSAQIIFGVITCVVNTHPTHVITSNSYVQSLLTMGELRPKHVEALASNKQRKVCQVGVDSFNVP
jgi:hypothetical protein